MRSLGRSRTDSKARGETDREQRVAHWPLAIAYVAQGLAEPLIHREQRLTFRSLLVLVVCGDLLEIARLEKRAVVEEKVVLAPVDLELAQG